MYNVHDKKGIGVGFWHHICRVFILFVCSLLFFFFFVDVDVVVVAVVECNENSIQTNVA